MSKSPLEEYFDFAENILGIKQIHVRQTLSESTQMNSVRLLITVLDLESYSEIEIELLYKMISALQLDEAIYAVVNPSQKQNYPHQYELAFVDSVSPKVIGGTTDSIMETHSPRVLVRLPALKKQAWQDMQSLLQKI
ncbi:MAG: hypothetical protein WA160_15795 [Pseudobdellovibrio sp.]